MNTKIDWVHAEDQVNELTYIMDFKDFLGYPGSLGVLEIQNDTSTLYDIGNNGLSYILTRK